MKRLGFVVIAAFVTQSAWGCRIVCSRGSELWHLLADGETEQFQVLSDSETVSRGLHCFLPKTTGSAKEQEEQRLVNRCTQTTPEGHELVFISEHVQKRSLELQKTENSKTQEPVVNSDNSLVWRWELHRKAKGDQKGSVEILRTVSFPYEECGSAEER